MFGLIPGLITLRLTAVIGGLLVAPVVMTSMARHDRFSLASALPWWKALLISATSFLVMFGPLVIPSTVDLLLFSFLRGSLAEALPWAVPWFLAAFFLGCLVTSAVLKLPFWQAVSWWGMALAVSLVISWVGAVGAVLLYRYALLPRFTDFF